MADHRAPPPHRAEELGAWARYPLTGLCCWCARRHMPCRRERAEMIQPKNVHLSQQGAQAVDAPTIAGSANSVPVVDGVAPKLSLRAEIIGRDSGDEPA